MKPLLVLARITLVGLLWSIVFIEGVRVIVLENWRFDIFWPPHWGYAWNLWQSGWVIDTPKEWAFILILLTFIPLWLTGWIALSLIPWERLIYNIIALPFKLIRRTVRPIAQAVTTAPVVVKRKSYKEVRPSGRRLPISDYKAPTTPAVSYAPTTPAVSFAPAPSAQSSAIASTTTRREMPVSDPLSHSVFNLDDEDDSFDLDIDSFEQSDIFKIDSEKNKKSRAFEQQEQRIHPQQHTDRHISEDIFDDEDDDLDDYEPAPRRSPAPKRRNNRFDEENESYSSDRRSSSKERTTRSERREPQRETQREKSRSSGGNIGDILLNKGYDVVRNITIRGTLVDYVAISEDRILLCMTDKETGDWLADEERFNDEEPLWFSENAHRISPVRTIDLARRQFEKLLSSSDFDMDIEPYVIVTAGNIINAEDMFETWDDLNVKVVRYGKGKPTDLPNFQQLVVETKDRLSRDDLVRLKKLMKKMI